MLLKHRLYPAAIAASVALVMIGVPTTSSAQPSEGAPTAQATVTKDVSFAILEDYDKGQDLADIAQDFQLMNELGIDTLRCSFGWDDYEPQRGQYDFVWLQQFVQLAADHGIKLRPYLAYTAPWAGNDGDGTYWNDPPADYQDWYNFVHNLASALSAYPNVLSYEIYNEENDSFWWEGDVEQYKETLRQGALAVRVADPGAQVIIGGLVFPDYDWMAPIIQNGYAQYYDITPFHAYPETWSRNNIVVENYLDVQYHDWFVPLNNNEGEGEPIWINEMGFATTPGKTEGQQANWWARAFATFLADPHIEHLGVYEIKDLDPNSPAIGDEANYHLGLTYTDRQKKLAFHTVDMLTDLLDVGSLTIADDEADVTVTSGRASDLHHHLFKRPDGKQVLFVYDKGASPTVSVTVQSPGSAATRYALDGSSTPHADFDGQTLSNINLAEGEVAIFQIDP